MKDHERGAVENVERGEENLSELRCFVAELSIAEELAKPTRGGARRKLTMETTEFPSSMAADSGPTRDSRGAVR